MGQIIVRKLDDNVITRLKAKAEARGTSLEQIVRDILDEAARPSKDELLREMDEIRKRIGPVDIDSTALIREDRDSR